MAIFNQELNKELEQDMYDYDKIPHQPKLISTKEYINKKLFNKS